MLYSVSAFGQDLTENELREILRMKADLDHCEDQRSVDKNQIESLVIINARQKESIETYEVMLKDEQRISRLHREETDAAIESITMLEDQNKVLGFKTKLLTIGIPAAAIGGIYLGWKYLP